MESKKTKNRTKDDFSEKFFNKQFWRDLTLVVISLILGFGSAVCGGYFVYYLTIDESPQLFITSSESNGNLLVRVVNWGKSPALDFKLSYATDLPPKEIPMIEKEESIKLSLLSIVKEFNKSDMNLKSYDWIQYPININLVPSCKNCASSDIVEGSSIKNKNIRCTMLPSKELSCSLVEVVDISKIPPKLAASVSLSKY